MNLLNRLLSDPENEIFARTVEKIRVYRERKAQISQEEKKFHDTHPGQVWLVNDGKVTFLDETDTRNYHDLRPGVTGRPEPADPPKTLQWVPLSSNISNRKPETVVYLDPATDPVANPCVALVHHFLWFRPQTLLEKKGKLSKSKTTELLEKLDTIAGHNE